MRFIELDADPLAGLTPAERRILERAMAEGWVYRPSAGWTFPRGTSGRAMVAAARVLKKLDATAGLPLPVPPQPADWHVWQYHREGWKYDALAAPDSPARQDLRGSTSASRKVLAINAAKRIKRFLRECEARGCCWWFRAVERAVTD
jgi:hypothetical protein